MQNALHDAVRDPSIHAPGAILHVQSPKLGRGRPRPHRAGRTDTPRRSLSRRHIVKMFVAVASLQLAERGQLSLDARLVEVLPASVTGRIANAPDITVRMLLGHRAGIPDWDSPAVDEQGRP